MSTPFVSGVLWVLRMNNVYFPKQNLAIGLTDMITFPEKFEPICKITQASLQEGLTFVVYSSSHSYCT